MPLSKSTRPRGGSTGFHGERGAASPASWQLRDSAGNHWYLWFDTNGALRQADAATFEAAAFNFNTGGDLVAGVGGAQSGVAGQATQASQILTKKTGIANNTATAVIAVTVPNGNHAASIKVRLLGTLGAGADTFESSRVAEGLVVIARQTGANAVAVAAALDLVQIATVAGGGTLTLAYAVSAIAGAVGAVNTFNITVTLVVTGTITDHQCVVLAELINAEASGVTMAAA